MDFGLSEEQKLIVETTRAFVENELYPHEGEVERTGHLRRELSRGAAGQGDDRRPLRRQHAGRSRRRRARLRLTWLLYEKELGRANYALHWTCVARPSNILLACNAEQREKISASRHPRREVRIASP